MTGEPECPPAPVPSATPPRAGADPGRLDGARTCSGEHTCRDLRRLYPLWALMYRATRASPSTRRAHCASAATEGKSDADAAAEAVALLGAVQRKQRNDVTCGPVAPSADGSATLAEEVAWLLR